MIDIILRLYGLILISFRINIKVKIDMIATVSLIKHYSGGNCSLNADLALAIHVGNLIS